MPARYRAALGAGAWGYVYKLSAGTELVRCYRRPASRPQVCQRRHQRRRLTVPNVEFSSPLQSGRTSEGRGLMTSPSGHCLHSAIAGTENKPKAVRLVVLFSGNRWLSVLHRACGIYDCRFGLESYPVSTRREHLRRMIWQSPSRVVPDESPPLRADARPSQTWRHSE